MVDIRLFRRLHHHPQQRLGSTGPHQHSPATSHRRFGGLNLLQQGQAGLPAGALAAIGNGDVHQFLGIGLEAAIQPVTQRSPLGLDQTRHLQGRQQAVPAHAVAGREDVAGLLAAQGRPQLLHGGMHVLIADGGALENAPAGLPGALEAKVAHHRGDDPVLR